MKVRSAVTCLSIASVVAFGAKPASAATCNEAFDQSQVERDAGKLRDARQLLRACAAPTCSPTQQRLCTEWLGDVDARVPSVLLSAKDRAGNDVLSVTVQVDGAGSFHLDGRPIDLDPGQHEFTFLAPDGRSAVVRALVEERQKGLPVNAVLEDPRLPVAAAAVAPAPSPRSGPWRTAGYVSGAAGLAGLIVGGILGGAAIASKSAAHCNAMSMCDDPHGDLATARTEAGASTTAFIVGGVLAATGVVLVLAAPRRGTVGLALAPLVARGGSGLLLVGGL